MKKSKSVWVYLFYTILVLTWRSSFILMKRGLEYYTAPQVATIRQFGQTSLEIENIRLIVEIDV